MGECGAGGILGCGDLARWFGWGAVVWPEVCRSVKKTIMYKLLFIVVLFVTERGLAQTDSATVVSGTPAAGTVTVVKDPRVDMLVRKQIEINEETTRDSRRNMPGFRIQVLNSPDRSKVFAAKAKVYQEFPDLKPYLLYQAPNYKLKVGNFKTQEEAEEMQKQLERLFPSGLYIIRDVIEVKVSDMPRDSTNQ